MSWASPGMLPRNAVLNDRRELPGMDHVGQRVLRPGHPDRGLEPVLDRRSPDHALRGRGPGQSRRGELERPPVIWFPWPGVARLPAATRENRFNLSLNAGLAPYFDIYARIPYQRITAGASLDWRPSDAWQVGASLTQPSPPTASRLRSRMARRASRRASPLSASSSSRRRLHPGPDPGFGPDHGQLSPVDGLLLAGPSRPVLPLDRPFGGSQCRAQETSIRSLLGPGVPRSGDKISPDCDHLDISWGPGRATS